MISFETMELLKSYWGDRVEAMACYCEVKYIDRSSKWACYIFGLNPDDDDEIACIIDGFDVEVCNWSLKELQRLYNGDGDYVIEDKEFRRVRASELFKRLSERKGR